MGIFRTAGITLVATLVSGLTVGIATAPAAHGATGISIAPSPVPVFGQDAPDPDVVATDTGYFAYTTGTTWGNHIGILKSDSPTSGWHTLNPPFESTAFPAFDANHAPASWQINNTQNAPGVFERGGRWVMYYAAQSKVTRQFCLSIATAAAPQGPFVDQSGSQPWLCLDAFGGVTDPSPFVDSDGRAWLNFKTSTGSTMDPARLWAAPLDATGLHMLPGAHTLMTQRKDLYPWETTIENPQMITTGGVHYLLFSGGHWDSADYAEGYALCASASGPCAQPQPLPFLGRYGSVLGPGGATAFHDPGGKWWLAYHGWSAPCTAYTCGGLRRMYVAPLNLPGSAIGESPTASMAAASDGHGYWVAERNGQVHGFGSAHLFGPSLNGVASPIVGMTAAPDGRGYWLVASDGGIFAFGSAKFFGSTGAIALARPIVGMTAAPDGRGYWLVASDGGIFAFGSAKFFGSTGAIALARPIVGMTAAPDGRGYWLVASDGGIFAFGSAKFFGSTGAIALARPIVGMTAAPDGRGYWLVASDGGIFAFGSAKFFGSTGAIALARPIVGMTAAPDGRGYWFVASDGGIFAFGSAKFFGSTG